MQFEFQRSLHCQLNTRIYGNCRIVGRVLIYGDDLGIVTYTGCIKNTSINFGRNQKQRNMCQEILEKTIEKHFLLLFASYFSTVLASGAPSVILNVFEF